ncbi:MAG: hypothetical protein GY861_22665 [bacterium]|nr:hypothetical protein [bacterium]
MKKLISKKRFNNSEPIETAKSVKNFEVSTNNVLKSRKKARLNTEETVEKKFDVKLASNKRSSGKSVVSIVFDGLGKEQKYSITFAANDIYQAMYDEEQDRVYPDFLDIAVKHGIASIKR